MIEDICSLFKLFGISQDEVKNKLLYSSLYGDVRKWFKYLNK
jgi:hypothetical protein